MWGSRDAEEGPRVATTTRLSGPPLDPRLVELTGETLIELLDRAVVRTPDRMCLVLRRGLRDERWTYRELGLRSHQVAARLAARDVNPGDRVITWGPNEPWLVAACFGIWRLGAICVPLDLRMRHDVVERVVRRTDPALALVADGQAIEAMRELGVEVERIGPELGREPPAGDRRRSLPAVSPETVAEIVCTSGTTSDPKGVVLTHGQVIHSARVIAQTGMGPSPERGLSVIPLSHMYGQIVPLFLSLISGSTLVFENVLSTAALTGTLQRERITALTAVPRLLSLINASIESGAARRGALERLQRLRRITRYLPMRARRWPYRRSIHRALGGHLQVITSGGAALPPALQQAWEDIGVPVVQGYGGTECAAITGHTRASRRPGSAGAPLAGLEVRIAPGGELLVRGPSVMSGYWDAPEATAEVLDPDGWLHTGDAARFDGGEVTILGRTRDRIALPSGLKVYPEDIEVALRATGVVREAVALDAPPGRLAAVVLPEDESATDEAIAAAVGEANGRLGMHQRVHHWRRWPGGDMPRTHTLKIRREEVKAWYRDAEETAEETAEREAHDGLAPHGIGSGTGEAAGTSPGIGRLERLCELVAAAIAVPGEPPREVTAATPLDSLDLDSLGRVELAARLEEAFDIRLSDEEVGRAGDVAALDEMIAAASGRATVAPANDWAVGRVAGLLRGVLDVTVTEAAIRMIAHPRAAGLEHLDEVDGPVLICPNHTSHLDAPVVRQMLPAARRRRSVIAAAADYFFTGRLVGTVVAAAMGAFPFGRSADIRASLERVVDFLAQGWSVIIFPEGTRSIDGHLGPMREGIGLLATSVDVPIVPARISGAHQILPKGRALPRRRRDSHVTVRFGAPIRLPPGTSSREATRLVADAIASLGGPDEGT